MSVPMRRLKYILHEVVRKGWCRMDRYIDQESVFRFSFTLLFWLGIYLLHPIKSLVFYPVACTCVSFDTLIHLHLP